MEPIAYCLSQIKTGYAFGISALQVGQRQMGLLVMNILLVYMFLSESGQVAYASLASATFEAGMQLYKYRPKYHLGVHIPLDIQWPLAINPWST